MGYTWGSRDGDYVPDEYQIKDHCIQLLIETMDNFEERLKEGSTMTYSDCGRFKVTFEVVDDDGLRIEGKLEFIPVS